MWQSIVKTDFGANWTAEIADQVAEIIVSSLQRDQKVLLALSGGSVVEAYKLLLGKLAQSELTNLHFMLVDERVFAEDSNEVNHKLLDAAGVISGLQERGAHYVELPHSLIVAEAKISALNTQLEALLADSKVTKVAVLGVGTDGHTAGVKPMETSKFQQLFLGTDALALYPALDFPHRLTLTITALQRFDYAIVGMRKDKAEILQRFQAEFGNRDAREPEVLAEFPALGLLPIANLQVVSE
jgi:6-phosphogluconolactonase/glucosamine-6-phosphate isomerase/deaminase